MDTITFLTNKFYGVSSPHQNESGFSVKYNMGIYCPLSHVIKTAWLA